MATLTPSFRDFLPAWVAAQPWYQGSGIPVLSLVGAFRLEDPAGETGIETHLLNDGTTTYQVPMTYRGAPLAGAAGPPEAAGPPGAGGAAAGTARPTDVSVGRAGALIVTAEHSELGTRWIYDAEGDPVWRAEILRLVREGRTVESRTDAGDVVTAVTGRPLDPVRLTGSLDARLTAGLAASTTIELRRVLVPGPPPDDPGVAGLVLGAWRRGGFRAPDTDTVTGCLAVVRTGLR